MPKRYDLHTHTHFSDGTLTPAELVARAHAQGVDVLALTDHDVTDGIAPARAAARECGLTLLAGVEVSVTWRSQTLHVIGLSVDVDNAALQSGLAQLREFRNWRAQEIDRRLAKKKIHGAYDYCAKLARGPILSRTHFARFLVEGGFARDTGHAFKHFLGQGKPGYVPGQWAALSAAVAWIHDAGGIAALAHPARYKLSGGKMLRLIEEFKAAGGRAIEVVSGSQSPQENAHFAELAVTHQLLSSVGSDYHGPEKPWAELGRLPPLPAQCTPVWDALPENL